MKTTIGALLGLMLAAGGLLAGCDSDILNTAPTTEPSSGNFWKTSEDARRGLNGVYKVLPYVWFLESMPFRDVFSNNAHSEYAHEGYQEAALGNATASSRGIISGIWYGAYRGVGRANTLLDRLGDIDMDETTKERYRAEALFLRALYYQNIVDYYGSGPLYLNPPSLQQEDMEQASRAELVAQILKDLNEAVDILPPDAPEPGRATKGATLALKTRVLLYESRWEEAAQAAQKVMNMSYSLFPDYRGLFLEQNENNQEIIFDVQYSTDANVVHDYDRRLAPDGGGAPGYASMVPLPNLVADYYMIDGEPTSESSLYDPENPFAQRDPRLDQTIFHEGSYFRGQEIGEDFQPSYDYTGFWFKKYTSYDSTSTPAVTGGQSDINIIVLRYADVLLMYAEARNEASGPDGSVYSAINKVRDRAGMPDVEPGLNKSEMREEIRHERRIEFAGEGLYFSDLRRWGIAEEVIPAVEYEDRSFANRNYLFPIPQHEIDLNPNLEQNPGY